MTKVQTKFPTDSKMSSIQENIRHLMINRHSPEAMELYMLLMKYTHKRVLYITKTCGSDRLTYPEIEDLVSDVMLQLINGSLAQFRGSTIPELIAFVRTVTDRRIWRTRTKRIKDRELLNRIRSTREDALATTIDSPDDLVEFEPETPLNQEDEKYLEALIRAGSKAEYARQNDISRAAVTQRVKRIVKRIESFTQADQMAVESWMNRMARNALLEPVLRLNTTAITS